MLAISPAPTWAAPQPLRVRRVHLHPASPETDDGRFWVSAVVDDSATPGTFESDLLAGDFRVGLADGASFAVRAALDRCRRSALGGAIVCKASSATLILVARPIRPSVYGVVIFARHLAASATGTERARAILTLTLSRSRGDLVDVISDCRFVASTTLHCFDRRRPNIVFIVSDDQRWDTLGYMPRVMADIAAKGVTFSNAFVTTPLCAPSRASMLTGQYAHHHGVLTNERPHGGFTASIGRDASSIATWLHTAGYRTGMYGKYLTDYLRNCPPYTASCYIPPGWDEWHVFFNQGYYNYQLAENASVSTFGDAPEDYSTDVLARKAVEFIESAHGQPFFLHIGFHAPHSEGPDFPKPAPRHFGAFAAIERWRPPSWDEEDVSDKPPWFADLPRAGDIFGGFLNYAGLADGTRRYQLETLLALDEAVGAIVDALEATGQTEDTVIVYTSDNGYLWGEHRVFAAKTYPFEESIRIPLVVKFPRIVDQPRVDSHLVLNIDLPPTLAQLGGAVPTTPVDGASFAPLLRGDARWRSDFAIEWWNFGDPGIPTYAGVRGERFKYVRYENTPAFELYDLDADPSELESRAGDASAGSIVAELSDRLDAILANREE